MFGEYFKFKVFRLLENASVSQKLISIHFYTCPWAFLHTPPGSYHNLAGRGNYSFPPGSIFENLFFCSREREKETIVRVLVINSDKSHHLYTLQIFGYCFAAP